MWRVGNTCYVLSTAQVLLRTPGVRDWIIEHAAHCDRGDASCIGCALNTTLGQMVSGFGRGRARQQAVVAQGSVRQYVGEEFGSGEQQDVCEYLERMLDKAREVELQGGRWSAWGNVQLVDMQAATHVDQLFGFVREDRL